MCELLTNLAGGNGSAVIPAAPVAAASTGYPQITLKFRYDYLGRRVEKLVIDTVSNRLISGRRFLYDGWNLIAEYALNASLSTLTLVRSYTWGLDIARTLSEAGGVGALLQIADHPSGKTYFPAYDGNGNIAALVNSSTGTVAAAYEYSPFGEQLRADAPDSVVADQPFRFSTKYTDSETGLVYYGRRYYNPGQGRFVGRDPAKEKGGLNLYGFCGNNSVNRWDILGMVSPEILQAEIEMLWDEIRKLEDEENNAYVSRGTNQQKIDAANTQLERLYDQLGRVAKGADDPFTPPNPTFGPPGSPTNHLTLNWSSKNIRIGGIIFEPVHQIAINRALAHLPEADRAILRTQQVVADADQSAVNQFRHALRDGLQTVTWKGPIIPQSIEEARQLANDYVRNQITRAQGLERDGDHPGALREFGLALHALQDSTSPSHAGFQSWGGPSSQSTWNHIVAERTYPGDDSDLFRVTQTAYGYFTGAIPMPANFFPPGP
jgi:RHS repeat-associated protein